MGKTTDLFKKIIFQGKISCKDGHSKGQKWYGPNRSRRYSEEVARIHRRTVQKDLQNPDNYNGVITQLEPDILECVVKWALRSIFTNKASGGDGFPVQLLQILKDDAVKVLYLTCQYIWRTPSMATGLEKISFHSNPKERQCQIMFKLLHNYDRKLSISIACYQNTYGQNISLCLWISKMRLC